LRLERWNKINSTNEGAIFSIFDPGSARIEDIVFRDVVEDKSGAKVLPGLDIVPTNFNLVDLEAEYTGDPKFPHYLIFQQQLAAIENEYDFILFDCPPNILRASQCGIFSSHEIVVPSNPDALSLIGFTLLVDKLGKFHQLSASFRTAAMGPPAQVWGVVFNSIKTGVDIEVPKMRMQLRMNQFKAAKRVSQDAKIFQTQIRDAMVVRRAVTLGLPVTMLSQDNDGDEQESVITDYRKLADEIIRMGGITS
jgi:chromosome partitioning protein